MTNTDRFLKLKEVESRVALKKTAIYGRMTRGEFPRQHDLGGGVVAWLESDITEWMASRPLVTDAA